MSIKHTTTVDIGDLRTLSKPIHLMQYDKSLPEIEVHITKDGQEYTIPSGYSATIRWGKPDKHGCTATGTVSGSTVTFQVTEQMACVAGRSKVTVEIVESDSSQAGTAKFEVIVDSNPIGDNTIVSDSEIADIQKAIEAGQNAVTASETATAKANEASTSATTASQKAEEAKESADSVANVMSDVSQLKGDLSDLAPAGASVGQLFRVAAISDDGKYTMEPVDMPSGGVTDVQVDGKTVVVDNVANIPIVTETSPGITPKIGGGLAIYDNTLMISAPVSYGLHVWGGDLGLSRTEYITIDNRAPGQLLPIQTGNIDYAVKAAMCDGKGDAWTDTERIAALLRMGCTVDDNGFVKWSAQEVTE